MKLRKSSKKKERRRHLLAQAFLKKLLRLKKMWRWFKVEWRKHYSVISISSERAVSERCGKLSTRKQKTNMR